MASDQKRFLERLTRLEAQLERVANDFFLTDSFAEWTYGSLWRPPTDVYDTESSVVVRMAVPGLHADDIVIILRSSTLIVRAVRRDPHPDRKRTYHQLEIHYGLFERVIALPKQIRHSEASAKYVDAPASTKSSGMCQTEMKLSTTLNGADRCAAFT